MARTQSVIPSFLDTDLYKLTMQCAVLRYFREIPATYSFTNRTPEKHFSREAFHWLRDQIHSLGNLRLSSGEHKYLQTHCPYFTEEYLDFLKEFRLRPQEQITVTFIPVDGQDSDSPSDLGDIAFDIHGKWVDTILYEIPLLSLASEAYFRFIDTDWDYDGQEELAYEKGLTLLQGGCHVSEFGTRRRRDFRTQEMVFRSLVRASKEAAARRYPGSLTGTSNVLLAMRFGFPPVGTVAHEWYMGIAAITQDYKAASELALRYWVDCFGDKLGIALTDTFGTPQFLESFSLPVKNADGTLVDPARFPNAIVHGGNSLTYAQLFTGVRQDSGDPAEYVKLLRAYYDRQGVAEPKTIVFSDSLDVAKCLEFKKLAEGAGFRPTFGVGTFFTNDFMRQTTGAKSTPLNIVIKLSSANGNHAIKISDVLSKNTGDRETVRKVKEELGYIEKEWAGGDESARWGR